MRRAQSKLALCVLGVLCSFASAGQAGAASIPVHRCATVSGVSGTSPATPSRLRVARAARKLTAYTNGESYLLAPSDMRCAGIAAADGGSQLAIWPAGRRPLLPRSRRDGLTLRLEPACVGCKAGAACPFFASYARELGFPCTVGLPLGERLLRPRPRLVLFEDRPGLAGDGWPSGGPDPANGVVGYTRAPYGGHVYRATCTLPARRASVCTASLNDVINRYG